MLWQSFCGLLANFFPVLSSSHQYPSMVGALLCITVSSSSWTIYAIIAVTLPLVKSWSWYCFYRLQCGLHNRIIWARTSICLSLRVMGQICSGYMSFLLRGILSQQLFLMYIARLQEFANLFLRHGVMGYANKSRKKKSWCTASFEPWTLEVKDITKRTLFYW